MSLGCCGSKPPLAVCYIDEERKERAKDVRKNRTLSTKGELIDK